jgi:HSP20 family molecular chaperone IbpA
MNAVQEKTRQADRAIAPLADIYETQNEYILKLEVPGAVKEHIDVTVDNDELEIRASVPEEKLEGASERYSEYRLYDYYRTFRVGSDINRGKINATLENGILTIVLEKHEEVKPRKIEITAH